MCLTASCSGEKVVPAPCPADGREVQVFFSTPDGKLMSDVGSFVGWNEYWVSIELQGGRVIHHSADTVTAIHDLSR